LFDAAFDRSVGGELAQTPIPAMTWRRALRDDLDVGRAGGGELRLLEAEFADVDAASRGPRAGRAARAAEGQKRSQAPLGAAVVTGARSSALEGPTAEAEHICDSEDARCEGVRRLGPGREGSHVAHEIWRRDGGRSPTGAIRPRPATSNSLPQLG
jgi:hypothetical protein